MKHSRLTDEQIASRIRVRVDYESEPVDIDAILADFLLDFVRSLEPSAEDAEISTTPNKEENDG